MATKVLSNRSTVVLLACMALVGISSSGFAAEGDRTGTKFSRLFNEDQRTWFEAEQRGGTGATYADLIVFREKAALKAKTDKRQSESEQAQLNKMYLINPGMPNASAYKTSESAATVVDANSTNRPFALNLIDMTPHLRVPAVGDEFEMISRGKFENVYHRILITSVTTANVGFVDELGQSGLIDSDSMAVSASVDRLERGGLQISVGDTLYSKSWTWRGTKLERIGVVARIYSGGNIYLFDDKGEPKLWQSIYRAREQGVVRRAEPVAKQLPIPPSCGLIF